MLLEPQELPQKIKEIRGEQSQADFGLRFGVSRQAVDRWEKGTAVPSAHVLRELQIEKVFLITESV
jgi:DNA-binding transcriptional regulator YiaG